MSDLVKIHEPVDGKEAFSYVLLPDEVDLMALLFEGAEDLLTADEVRRHAFLNEKEKTADRQALKELLQLWQEMAQHGPGIDQMVSHCLSQAEAQEEAIRKNLSEIVKAIQPIEVTYRGLSFFLENAGTEQVSNVSFVNCDISQLNDLNFSTFFDYITNEFKSNFDRIDLRNNYSLLVLPGYLGSNAVFDKWTKAAYDNKLMMVTDFENLDEVDDVMEVFEAAGLASGDVHKSSALVCCNWLVGRSGYELIDEEDDLFVPPSWALSGKIYASLLSQVAAGKKFGVISGVDGVRFSLKKSEVSALEKMSLVPMFKEYGKVLAFSAKTLFNGSNLGLQIYSVVRVFDYVTKVLMDFLNRRAFENFNANIRKELMGQIVKFLDGISGNGRLIEDFSIMRFEQDAAQKDKIHLDIHLKPYFPAKNFMIKMEGKKDEEGARWDTSYDQQ